MEDQITDVEELGNNVYGIKDAAPVEQPSAPMPKYYDISVEREDVSVEYDKVAAFQIKDGFLFIDRPGSSSIVPLNTNVLSVDVTPVYLEGV